MEYAQLSPPFDATYLLVVDVDDREVSAQLGLSRGDVYAGFTS
jgi:hypothetical protein